MSGASLSLVEFVSLSKTARSFPTGSQTSEFPVFLDSSTHPVNLRIPRDCVVVDVNHDDLEILVGRILTHPVRVHNTQTLKATSNTFLSKILQVPLRLLLIDRSRSLWFTIRTSLGYGPFPSPPPHRNPVYDISLLGLVSQPAGLVRTRGTGSTVDLGKLPVLPATNPQQVTHDVTLLLPVQLRHILVSPHCDFSSRSESSNKSLV